VHGNDLPLRTATQVPTYIGRSVGADLGVLLDQDDAVIDFSVWLSLGYMIRDP
jgi:hypothetical protein